MGNNRRFAFDGGAGNYLGTALLGFLITLVTLGICYPFALVLMQRWRCKHTSIDGRRLVFTGSAGSLFWRWVGWLLLSVVTIGVYVIWMKPRLQRWIVEHTDFGEPTAPLHMFMPVAA